ncbi:hypothetical protein L5515_004773 [Caenorhabditis briggsae]|uniref:TPR_REGION domain-containing protein n=2 Tax=Caenorhabditis briggsae TaxID=6238 RepID=A0AAE9EMU6_CAEBR|nr:hypothetical protein L5515_004773 [Caenorhabditis briggsae]
MEEDNDEVPEIRTIAIPLKDSQEDGTHLKRLRRFSIEVWNLTQNWATASEKSVQYVESIINSRLKLLYSKDDEADESAKLTKDQTDRIFNDIVVANSKLNQTMSDFERIISKFEVARGRMSAWKLLTEKSSNAEEKYIVETLDTNLPEVIEINCSELPDGAEVLSILEAEEAKLSYWIEVALEYFRQDRVQPFMEILEAAGTRAGLEYDGVKQDQMRALDILAAYWMTQGYRERAKDKKQDFFSKATVLFNTADKIAMYEWSHLTVRAWFYLFERDKSTNKYELADQQFNYVVKTYPQNVLPLIGKAVIAFNKKDYKTAIFYFRKAIRQRRYSIADLRVGIGYCFAKMGLVDKSKLAFERALELEPDNVSAMCGLGIILLNTLEQDNLKIAVNLFGRAYHAQPDQPVALVHLANHFFFKGEVERAWQLSWHAASNDCDSIKAEAFYQMGRCRHTQGQYDGAYKYYYQARQANNQEHTLAHYGLGQMYIHRNEIEEAIKCFEVVHQRLPHNTDTMKILGSLYAHVQLADPARTNEARQKGRDVLAKYLNIEAEDCEACIDLAQLLESTDSKKSLELYERAIDLLEAFEQIPPQPEMLNNVGALHMSMKQFDKAEHYFKKAKESLEEQLSSEAAQFSDRRAAPERSHLLTIRYNLARCLEHLCRTSEAEQMYKDIISECPGYTDGYLRLGCIARDRHQVYEASLSFKQGVQFDQSSPVVWTLIGNLHYAKNEWMPAQKKFEFILSKIYNNKTPDPYSLVALGNVWIEQLLNPSRKKEDEKKYMDRALQMYQKALKLEPKNMYAANGIGCVLAYKRNWNDARDVFSQVRESTSEFYDVWMNIAHVFMEREQWMSAVQMYSSAMKKFRKENDAMLLHYLAKAYYRANMLSEAKEALERAMLDQLDNTQLKFNYAIVLKKSAKEILRGHKMTSQQVNTAISDLTFAEKIFQYISKNDDRQASHTGMRISRTACSEEAKNCRDLLTQAKHKLAAAQTQDEEERRLIEKQEKEKIALKNKLMEEARAREEAEKKRIEDAKNLRLSFIEMTKDVLRLPEIVEEKRRGGGGRKRRNDDGDEFVNDSSDAGNYDGEEGGEDGERRERRKKDKAAKKASRKKRERRDSDGGSDSNRRDEKKRKRKEEKARKLEEKLSAKQSAKIKSRAFLSSSESSDDDKPKPAADSSDEEEDERPPVNEFDSPDSNAGSDEEMAAAKKKKKKAVVDSDEGSDNSDDDRPIIGASDEDDDDKPAAGGASSGSDSDVPKEKVVESDSD